MLEHESKRLKLILFSLELKKVAIADKNKLAELLGVRISDSWPGPDLAEALPFFIAEMEKHPSEPIWDSLIIHKDDNTLIGDIGFHGPPDTSGRVEIGYSIIPEYRNQGYATEMTCHIIAWAWQQPGVTSVIAECLDDNLSSIKVLEKAGLRRVSTEGRMLRWEKHREM
jgi:[ribosomal protein S5]-alanine N-acetyltransferase